MKLPQIAEVDILKNYVVDTAQDRPRKRPKCAIQYVSTNYQKLVQGVASEKTAHIRMYGDVDYAWADARRMQRCTHRSFSE